MITFRSFIQRKSRPVVSVLGSLLRFRNVVLPLLFGAILVFTHAQQVHAGPKDGNVVAGDANIVQLNPKLLEIIQGSDKVIIDWRSFSIEWDELVRFLQPDSDSIALNRVNGDTPSYILGQLTADGRVMLINPNGVLFGDSAVVDIGSLVATTIDIRNEDFMAGDYNFDVDRASGGTVVNRGRITAAEGGIVALVAPGVENSGVIVARLGRVALASGNSFALDFYGDRLIQIGVDDSVAERLLAPDGTELKALVDNSGEIYADGGTVMLMAASVAKDVVDYAINMEGIIEARTATERNGQIVLEGAGEGIVRVTGTLDASGRESGDTGGDVKILGSKVGLVGQAEVDVSGDAGGGEVLIGGNFQGRGPERNADFTTIGSEVAIQADALTTGDGGRVIVWSDRVTRFYGNISARGGRDSGDGGFAEISGKQHLQFAPNSIDLSAPKGLIGELLLDPLDIFISDGNGSDDSVFSGDNVINFNDDSTATYNITPAAFEAIDADITLQALRDITVNSPIDRDGSGDSTLTLQAGNNLIINANITGSMGAHSFIFEADSPRSSNNDGIGKLEIASGVTITSNNGDITLIGARFEIDTSSMTSIDAGTGDIYVAPSQASLMTISTTADLSLAEIGRFTTSGTIYIGTATTGPSGSGGPGISISVIGITVSEALTISGSASLVLDSGGTTTLSADISTNGNITFEDAVTLAANVTVDSDANDDGAGGDITFTSTVDSTIVPGQGYRTLTLDAADGSVALQGVVGNTSALRNLANLAVTGGSITLSADVSTDDGDITFSGPVTLAANVTVDSDALGGTTGGNIKFESTVDGDYALTLDAGGGTVELQGAVGAATKLVSLAVTGGTIKLSADISTDNGAITFTGAVELVGDVTVDSDSAGGAITFTSTVISAAGGNRTLTVNAGSGAVEFRGAVGVTDPTDPTTKLASLTVDGGQIDLDTVATTGAIEIESGTGINEGINLNGASYQSDDGDITFRGPVDLHADVTVDSDADEDATDGEIKFTSTVDGAHALTLDADRGVLGASGPPRVGGKVTLLGAVGGTSATSKLASLTVKAIEVSLKSVSTTGLITINSNNINLDGNYLSDNANITIDVFEIGIALLTLDGAVRLDSDAAAGEINISAWVTGGHMLTLDAGGIVNVAGEIGGDSGGLTKLASLTVVGGQIELYNVATTGPIDIEGTDIDLNGASYESDNGAITFSGPVGLVGDVTVATAGNITFTSTVTSQTMPGVPNRELTVNAGSGTVAFQGVVGGTDATTKLSELAVTGGKIELSANVSTDNGAITFTGAVELLGDVTVDSDSAGGAITFTSTVDSASGGNRTLTVNAGSGTVAFEGAVGATSATTKLSELAVTGGKIELSANVSTDNGAITFTGAVELLGDVTVDSAAGGDITFTSTVTSQTMQGVPNRELTVNAGSGTVAFQGVVGGTDATTKLSELAVTGGQIDLDAVATTGAIAIEGTDIDLNGASYRSDTGAITFTGPVDLHADVTVATAGAITFTSTVEGTQALTVNAGSGTVAFEGAVGGTTATTALVSLAVTGGQIDLDAVATTGAIAIEGTDIDLNGASYRSDTGAITFTGPVDLHADVTVATAGAITFTSTVEGTQALTVNAGSGTVAFEGAVGGTTATTALVSLAVTGGQIDLDAVATTGAIAIEGTDIDLNGASYRSDTGAITFTGPVDLHADVTVATAGAITFTSTVEGTQALTVNAGSGTVAFEGAVGGTTATTALVSLAVTGGQIDLDAVATTGAIAIEGTDIDLNGASYRSDTGAITFTGPVDLHADVTVATAGAITFTSTVEGTQALTVNAGSGTVAFEGAVGGTTATTALVSLAVTGGQIDLDAVATTGAIAIEGTDIDLNGASYRSDTGAITFTGPVDLHADVTVATAGAITFTSTVEGTQALTVNAGSGTVAFEGAVGGTTATTALVSLAVTGGQIDLDAVATTGAIAIEGTDIDLNGASYRSDTGAITFTGPVDLHADVTVATAGAITFTSTVEGTQALTVNAGSGTVAFEGAVGGTTATTALVSLAVTGGQIDLDTVATTGAIAIEGTDIDLNGASYRSDTGAITFTGPVDLHADVTVATAGAITFTSTVEGTQALTVNAGSGTVAFEGAVGGTTATTALVSLAVTGGQIDLDAVATTGAIAIEGTDIDLNGASYRSDTGAITFTGPVDLHADVTVATAGAITFTSTVEGTQALTVNAGSGTVAFEGAVGGTTATTALVSLAVTGGQIDLDAVATTGAIAIEGTDIDLNGASYRSDTGAITFTGPVDLHADVTVATAGAITFTSTVEGTQALTVNAGSGTVAFEGAVGGTTATTALVSLAVTGGQIDLDAVATTGAIAIEGTDIDLNGASYRSDTGAITFTGPVDLHADVTVATAGAITFTSTVEGTQALTVNAGSGTVAFEGAVGGTTATTALVSLAVTGGQIDLDAVATTGAIAIEGTDIDLNGASYRSDTGAITFTGPVDLHADVTVATAGAITFTSTVEGTQALTVNAGSGTVAFEGAVGGTTATTALVSLAVTGGQIDLDAVATTGAIAIEGTDIDLNGASYRSDTGAITFTGPVDLHADVTVATAGAITFTSTVEGTQALTVNAGSGTVAFEGAVGGTTATTALVSLAVTGGQIDLDAVATTGAIAIEGTDIDLNGASYRSDTGAITFTGPVDLHADVTVATAGAITFTSTVEGTQALTVNAGSGTVAFEGAVGGTTATTALVSLAVTGGQIDLDAVATTGAIAIEGTDIDLNGASYRSDTGAITFTGPVDLHADVTVATAGAITFTSTVEGTQALTVNAGSGTVAFEGAVGGTTATTALVSLAVTGGQIDLDAVATTGAIAIEGTDIDLNGASYRSDTGAITFTGPVDLHADVTVATAGAITFTSTVEGTQALTVNAGSGTVAFEGAVGGTTATTALVSLAVTGGQIDLDAVATTGAIAIEGTDIDLNGASYRSDTGAITFTGPVDLHADVTVATAGAITFTSTVEGTQALTVNAGSGTVAFEGAVGGTTATTALVSLAVTGGQIDLDAVATTGAIAIEGTDIDLNGASYRSDTGAITFTGPVDLHADVTVATAGAITFTSTVEGTQALTVNAGSGTVAFEGAVGGTTATTALVSLAVTGGQIDLDAVATTGAIAIEGTDIDLNGASYRSDTGAITFTGPVDLHADVTVATAGAITFTSTVEGTQALTVNAGSGTVAFEGAVGGTTATTALVSLAVTGGQIDLDAVATTGAIAIEGTDIDLNGASYRSDTGAITFTGPVDLHADVTVATAGAITFTSTVEGTQALTVNAGSGTVAFEGAVGGTTATTALVSLAVTGGQIDLDAVATTGAIAIEGTDIDLNGASYRSDTGAITFTGPVDLHADVTVATAGAITFTSTVEGTQALTVNAGSGTVAFEGAVGGTTATTALVSLAVTGGQIDLDAVATTGAIAIEGTDIDLNGASYRSDTGAITFTGPVDLHADVTVATAGAITFTSTVEGTQALTVNAGSGTVAFEGAVGGTSATTKLVSLTVTGGDIDLDTVATTGNININGSTGIALNGATYASDNGDITLGGAGDVTISGSLDSTVSLQAGGDLTINTDITGRNGAHSLIFEADSPGLSSNDGNGTLTIASGVTITSNNGDITLIGAEFDIDTSSSINAGTGDIHVAPSRAVAMTISTMANLSLAEIGRFTTSGTIYIGTATTGPTGTGGAGSSISAISITVSEDLTISGSASLVLDSSGATTLSAKVSTDDGNITFADAVTLSADVSTDDGNITFADAVTLGADVTVASDADGDGTGGDIRFISMLDGAYNLTLNSGTGNIYFGGDVGSADKLSAITVNNAHDVTVATTMWVGSFTQTAGTGTTDFGLNTVNADTSVEVSTVNIRGSIVAQEARLTAQEDITAFVEVDALTIEASNAYLFGTIDGVGGRAASDLIVINNRGSGTYTINDSIVLGTGLGTRTYVELSSLPLATITPAAGVFAWLTPMLRASVNDSISGPYIVTDSEASSPLLTPEPGTEDYYEDIPLLLKTHDDEMVEME